MDYYKLPAIQSLIISVVLAISNRSSSCYLYLFFDVCCFCKRITKIICITNLTSCYKPISIWITEFRTSISSLVVICIIFTIFVSIIITGSPVSSSRDFGFPASTGLSFRLSQSVFVSPESTQPYFHDALY